MVGVSVVGLAVGVLIVGLLVVGALEGTVVGVLIFKLDVGFEVVVG